MFEISDIRRVFRVEDSSKADFSSLEIIFTVFSQI